MDPRWTLLRVLDSSVFDDGVVVIPAEIAEAGLSKVAQVAAREEAIRARILAGETTYDIFELDH